jgi:hypothetical protein
MQGFQSLGKILIIFGIFITVLGILFLFAGKTHWIGKLPGDIVIERKNFSLYIPIATSIILSILITLILWLISKR